MPPSQIVFHGENAICFRAGFETLVAAPCQVACLSDMLSTPGEREQYETAEVIIGVALNDSLPVPRRVRLFHVPGAGTDAIDTALLPDGALLCNCFGHETPIAEYVMAALLQRQVPLAQADTDLRRQRWTYQSGRATALHGELAGQTLGLLGFGHIARAILPRALAFGMRVIVANRSPLDEPRIARAYRLDQLTTFMAEADAVVAALPMTDETRGLVDARALAAMRPDALIVNVGRGPVIDEAALFDTLLNQRIGGAVIDTWYNYPDAQQPECAPSRFDFASLPNVVMTPHMSGWTVGTVRRRQQTIADNVRRWLTGAPPVSRVWPSF